VDFAKEKTLSISNLMTGEGWYAVIVNNGRYSYSEIVCWAVSTTADVPAGSVAGMVINPKGGGDLIFADTLGQVKTYARTLENAQSLSSQYQNGTLK
jgi:hypothetical protein